MKSVDRDMSSIIVAIRESIEMMLRVIVGTSISRRAIKASLARRCMISSRNNPRSRTSTEPRSARFELRAVGAEAFQFIV